MGRVTVRHLVVKGKASYWQPTKRMREAGFRPVRLAGSASAIVEQAEELNRKWDSWRGIGAPEILPGTVAYLRLSYSGRAEKDKQPVPGSFEFERLKPRTKEDYRDWLGPIEASFGDLPVKALTPRVIKIYYQATVEARGQYAGYHMMGAFRAFLSWCVSEDAIEDNPALKVKVTAPPARTVRWMPDQTAAMIAKAREVGRTSIALAVLLADWSAQRPFDVRDLKWSNYDGRNLVGLKQEKTGTELPPMPLSPQVKAELDATPKDSIYIIVSEGTKAPYTESNFTHVFAAIRAKAGLPKELHFADFRRTAATEMTDSGAGDDQLRSITGHKDRNVVARYAIPTGATSAEAVRKRLRHRKKAGKTPPVAT